MLLGLSIGTSFGGCQGSGKSERHQTSGRVVMSQGLSGFCDVSADECFSVAPAEGVEHGIVSCAERSPESNLARPARPCRCVADYTCEFPGSVNELPPVHLPPQAKGRASCSGAAILNTRSRQCMIRPGYCEIRSYLELLLEPWIPR